MFQKTRKAVMAIGFGFILTLAASSVAAQDVTTNAMPGVDFSKFHTYKWVTVEGAKYPNQIVDQQIKNSIDAQLSAKGLTKTDADNADLHIAYQVGMQQQTQWNAYGMGGRWAGGMASAESSTINIGTLVLDMYDPSAKQLVWTGRATKTVDPSKNPEKNQKNLDKAMAKLLKNYPPKS
ncbi:MAG: DUF4136 domain-containing protein [Terracidiphilus sp.]